MAQRSVQQLAGGQRERKSVQLLKVPMAAQLAALLEVPKVAKLVARLDHQVGLQEVPREVNVAMAHWAVRQVEARRVAPVEVMAMVAASAVTTAAVEGASERTRAPLVDAQAGAASAATQAAVVGASVRIQAPPLAGARAAAVAPGRVHHIGRMARPSLPGRTQAVGPPLP